MIETGKRRASRIALDYHAHRDRVQQWRWVGAWIAIVVSLFVAAFSVFGGGTFRAAVSHGPIAAVHAPWEDRCDACHQPFAPLRSDAWGARWSWKSGNHTWGHVASDRCETCHRGAPHHGSVQRAEDAESCSSCHHEHQGHSMKLSAVADEACLRCHDWLDQHRRSGAETQMSAAANHVTAFSLDHPKFRSLSHDPGAIKFPHDLHLARGLRLPEQNPQLDRRWSSYDDLHPPAGTPRDAPIQLECRHCHQLDRATTADENVRSDGRYMQPIRYDTHCRACHAGDLKIVAQDGSEVRIDHGLSPELLKEQLTAIAWKRILSARPDIGDIVLERSPLPGAVRDERLGKLAEATADEFQSAQNQIARSCEKCHQTQDELHGLPSKIVPSRIPSVWFRHAEFDHTAHRAINCLACHREAPGSKSSADVLIEGRETCIACHQPRTAVDSGGVRSQCVKCHVYHVDDRSSQGRASSRLAPSQTLWTDAFLRGGMETAAPLSPQGDAER
jgi:hypothetical protein